MLTTLNPKVCIFITVLSATLFIRDVMINGSNFVSFLVGVAATAPLISATWLIMKENWPLYRSFYSMSFYRRDMNVVRRSWQLTWWIIPYTLFVYSALEMFILFNSLGTVYTFFYGAIFTVFGYTLLQGPKYYEDARRAKDS